jgi:GMP synthase (glutamine-hydrolysing)
VIEHETEDPVHLMGTWMGDAVEVVACRPYDGEPLPESLEGYAGLVVMGGAMGANDDEKAAWLPGTRQLIRSAAGTGLPALCICLGHQLAAVAMGGEVLPNPRGRQFGLLPVGWAAAAADDPLFGAVADSPRALQWNDDIVTRLPEGAVRLATAPGGEVQAARYAETVWGVQWHPEVDEPLVRLWTADGGVDPAEAEAQLQDLARSSDELERSWRPLAVRFTELVRG